MLSTMILIIGEQLKNRMSPKLTCFSWI